MAHPPEPSAAPTFEAFGLDERIVTALGALGFETPTPIQASAMPPLLAGKNVIGRARTGSGKTAAFGLPLLQRVRDGEAPVRALVLCPTRELALQVTSALRDMAKKLPVRIVTVYGGSAYGPQLSALRRGVPIVVGTPGRVLDHLDRGTLDLSALEMLVLDEADEMLRMGFLEDVEKVLAAAPDSRQVALFSATMPPPIKAIVDQRVPEHEVIQVEETALSVNHIEQRALLVPDRFKVDALARLLGAEPIVAALVFARTRSGCAETADELARRGLAVDALHGDLSQAARERVLLRFRAGSLKVVVATDVAARGIDVDLVSHVINFDLPNAPESYVHRIGRTGRAGRKGVAINLVTRKERPRMRFFERKLNTQIEWVDVPSDAAIAAAERARLQAAVGAWEGEPEVIDALLDELAEGRSMREVARAAMALLAEERGVSLRAGLTDEPPSWARSGGRDRERERRKKEPSAKQPRGERKRGGDVDEIELFLPVGRKRGVRPNDIVGALANDAGIPGASIGRVDVHEFKTFVKVAREAGEQVLAEITELEVRGRMVPLAKARPRTGGPPRRDWKKKHGRKPPRRKVGRKRWARDD